MKNNSNNKYSKIKSLAIMLAILWTCGILLMIVGIVLTIVIGFDVDANSNKATKINTTGIIILTTCCGIGFLLALISQLVIPTILKKELLKCDEKNYQFLIQHVIKCHLYPLGGCFGLIQQINWVLSYKEKIDDQLEQKSKEMHETRLQKQMSEQKKIDDLYQKEITELDSENKN